MARRRRHDDITGTYVIDNMSGRTFPSLGIALSYAQTQCAVVQVPRVRIKCNDAIVAEVWRDDKGTVYTEARS